MRRFLKWGCLVSIGAVALFVVLLVLVDGGAKTASPAAPAAWQKVAVFTGDSMKQTESFTVKGREWRISWDTVPGKVGEMNFTILVYQEPQSLIGVAANVVGASRDSSVQRGAGRYYLGVNTAQPYTVTVEERP